MQSLNVLRDDIVLTGLKLVPIVHKKDKLILIFISESSIVYSYNTNRVNQRYQRFADYFEKQNVLSQQLIVYKKPSNKQYMSFCVKTFYSKTFCAKIETNI